MSLTVTRGSIHALVGENGAGKSTLGRIVAGVFQPDAGRLLLDGEEVALRSPREALERGVAAIAQELNVVPRLTVEENVFLGAEPRTAGFVGRRALRRRYERLAESAGFELPAAAPAGRLRPAEQQKIEILRALSRDAALIVMDEPTAALNREETAQLHEIVRSLARAGRTVLLDVAFPARGPRARRHRHRAARRARRAHLGRGRGDRGLAHPRDARAGR